MDPATDVKLKYLSGDWCDKDVVMLHACFQLLEDCIEQEKLLDGHIDWSHTEEAQRVEREIRELYEWWKTRRVLEEAQLNVLDPKEYEEDSKRLIQLIQLRKHLWT